MDWTNTSQWLMPLQCTVLRTCLRTCRDKQWKIVDDWASDWEVELNLRNIIHTCIFNFFYTSMRYNILLVYCFSLQQKTVNSKWYLFYLTYLGILKKIYITQSCRIFSPVDDCWNSIESSVYIFMIYL